MGWCGGRHRPHCGLRRVGRDCGRDDGMVTMQQYPIHNQKNLHDRIIEDRGETIVFRNADGEAEEAQPLHRTDEYVTICSKNGDWLRLWF